MFHRHEHEHEHGDRHAKHLTAADREGLLSEGAVIQGMVVRTEQSAADRAISRVRIRVRFKGDEIAEFDEELASLYQPAPGSPQALRLIEVREAQQLRHADRIPKIQLPLSDGSRVPVRYDAADHRRLVLDVPALRDRALHDYIQREQRPKQTPAGQGAASGPPWVVPAHCPNCGAPVDQAVASRARDPFCEFCHQPIPATPAAGAR